MPSTTPWNIPLVDPQVDSASLKTRLDAIANALNSALNTMLDKLTTALAGNEWITLPPVGATLGLPTGNKAPIVYRKEGDFVVIIGSASKSYGYNIFTMPIGSRPPGDLTIVDSSNSGNIFIFRADGNVEYSNINAIDITIDARYKAAVA